MKKYIWVIVYIVCMAGFLVYIRITNDIEAEIRKENKKTIRKFGHVIGDIEKLAKHMIVIKGNAELLTGENKKLWLKYKPELIKKGKDCYLYRIRFKNIVDKKLYKFAYDYLEREKMGGYPLYIKGHYNSRQKCKKEDYEDCNIYLMEKGIKVYDDDYECDEKQNKKK